MTEMHHGSAMVFCANDHVEIAVARDRQEGINCSCPNYIDTYEHLHAPPSFIGTPIARSSGGYARTYNRTLLTLKGAAMKIAKNTVVTVNYKLSDAQGNLIEE